MAKRSAATPPSCCACSPDACRSERPGTLIVVRMSSPCRGPKIQKHKNTKHSPQGTGELGPRPKHKNTKTQNTRPAGEAKHTKTQSTKTQGGGQPCHSGTSLAERRVECSVRSRRRLRLINVRMHAPVTALPFWSNRIRSGRRRSVGNDHSLRGWRLGVLREHDA